MKRFSILLATALLFAVATGCQKDPVGTTDPENAKAYAQLNITFANPTGTKADADAGDGYDAGTAAEYAVKTATLYFCQGSKVVKKHTISDPAQFTQSIVGDDVKYTSVIQNLSTGTYNVYATLNCELAVTDEVTNPTDPTTEAELQTLATISALPGTDLSKGIPMTSRNVDADNRATAANAGLYAIVQITEDNTKDNPCIINLSMERAWAKIAYDFETADNKFIVYEDRKETGTKIADVQLVEYKVNNQIKQWYAFRRTASLTDALVADNHGFGKFNNTSPAINDYVLDPTTTTKDKNFTDASMMQDPDGFTALPKADAALAYTYENGLHANSQIVGYVTTVQFKGKVIPEQVWKLNGSTVELATYGTDYNSSKTLFFYNNKFYLSIAALNADAHLGVTESNAKDFNVKIYKNSICYFNYYIKHIDNGNNSITGVMEYSIVRNNSYNIKVTKILSPGDDDQEEDTPTDTTPVEQVDTYFQVKLTIKPWVVRKQDAVLG